MIAEQKSYYTKDSETVFLHRRLDGHDPPHADDREQAKATRAPTS